MSFFLRLFRVVAFILGEYVRSARVLVETFAIMIAYYALFWRTSPPMAPASFFLLAGLVMVCLSFYTTSMIMSLGDRPQGYVLLTRRLGRSGYLIGYYLAAFAVAMCAYIVLSLLATILGPLEGMTPSIWLLGSIPLLLNVAIVAAAVAMLTPYVLTAGWRLTALATVAVAFSGSMFNSQTLRDLSPLLRNALGTLQIIASAPLLPMFTGFALSISRNYGGGNIAIPLVQLSLALGLLALALYAFARREITFQS